MKKTTDKQVLKFLTYLTKLEVIEAIGVARLLQIDLMTRPDDEEGDDKKAATITEKDYDVIMTEMIDAFIASPKDKRKFILETMKWAAMK